MSQSPQGFFSLSEAAQAIEKKRRIDFANNVKSLI